MQRAAVCIGVDRVAGKQTLKAAASSATEFAAWAKKQGCNTRLLVDDNNGHVSAKQVFNAVRDALTTPKLEQLIIYFSGHGFLMTADTEYWLLSDAGPDPNECINVYRSVTDARMSGIPHVIFVSDACRSVAEPAELRALGRTIIPDNQALGDYVDLPATEVDLFFATRPGKPAHEAKHKDAVEGYKAIFSTCLLDGVCKPERHMVKKITRDGQILHVVPSTELKPHLIAMVPKLARSYQVTLKQDPEVRHETQLPKFFGHVPKPPLMKSFASVKVAPVQPKPLEPMLPDAIEALGQKVGATPGEASEAALELAQAAGLVDEVSLPVPAKDGDDMSTGFTFRGARPVDVDAPGWEVVAPHEDTEIHGAWHLGLEPEEWGDFSPQGISLGVSFEDLKTGGTFPIIPFYRAIVIVDETGIRDVSYTPTKAHRNYREYTEVAKHTAQLRAYAAMATEHGEFRVTGESAVTFASRTRQDKLFDPMLGVYAAYSYAQAGRFDDVASIFRYMLNDNGAVPFDVLMLALFSRRDRPDPHTPVYPQIPMLRQGWSWLRPGDPLHQEFHEQLRPHLMPGLWTTIDAVGMTMIRENNRQPVTA